MAAKYSRLSTEDSKDTMTLDFSSAFTFEERDKDKQNTKYRSIFTYGNDMRLSDTKEVKQVSSDRFTWILVYLGYMLIYVMAFPIMIWFSIKRIKKGERMIVFRLGHMQRAKGPGLALVFPFIDRYFKKDVSLRAFSVPPKQVITCDKAIIEVGAEIYFQIVDVEKSVTNVQDLDRSTRVLVQTTLCNHLAQMNLADIESERRITADNIMEKSNSTSSSWGVQITRAELSQIKVLSKPLPKAAPSVMMPPGLFNIFGASVKISGAGTYFLDLLNGQGVIQEGPDPSGDPSATLTLTFDDLQAMLQGKLKPYQAYMSGRLIVAGDTAAALKLDQLANRVQAQ
ncbi:hypothetical protein EGW08_020178, partial [Elysia chlorotica]